MLGLSRLIRDERAKEAGDLAMTFAERNIASSYWSLRIAFGVVPVVAGLDKFTNLLTDWTMYLAPVVTAVGQLASIPPAICW